MAHQIKKLGIFCGSSHGNSSIYDKFAVNMADAMCDRNIDLVYGGAKIGIMGTIANRILSNGGNAYGVIPRALVEVEQAHENLTKLIIVKSMHERKAKIFSLSDGFVLLSGGFGSLDEFFEILTWSQLGIHSKPCGILNCNKYFDHLLAFLDYAVHEKFVKSAHRKMILVDRSPRKLLEKLKKYKVPKDTKW